MEELGCNGQRCSRGFLMSTGCSDHLIRLEGTVHSAFKAWASLKKQEWSYRGRKGPGRSEGDCANSSAWVGREKCKLLVPTPGHAFFVYSGAEAMYFSHEQLGLLRKLVKNLYLPMTDTLWFTLSLITGSDLDPSCAILPLSRTSEEHNSLCWAIPEWPDSSHGETRTREPQQKDCLNFPVLLQFNISCASNRFFFRVQVVKNSPKPSTSGGCRSYGSHLYVPTKAQQQWEKMTVRK